MRWRLFGGNEDKSIMINQRTPFSFQIISRFLLPALCGLSSFAFFFFIKGFGDIVH